MPRNVRRRIFYCLIFAFLVLGTGAVLYAKGWRIEFKPTFGIGRVGAIYVRTFPAGAALSLNGKPQKNDQGIFDRGTLVSDLLPATYMLTASEAGFQTWQIQAPVQSSFVTAFQNVVLVPTAAVAATTTPVQGLVLDGHTPILTTAQGFQTLSGMHIPGDTFLAASNDGNVVVTYAGVTRTYLETNLALATTTDLGQLAGQPISKTPALSFQAVPNDNTLFLVRTPNGLQLLRVPTAQTLALATTTVNAATTAAGRIAWSIYNAPTRTSFISYYDVSSQAFNMDADSVPGRVTQMALQSSGALFVITTDGSLYSLSSGQSSRVRLSENATSAVLSPDDASLAVLDAQGVQIFSPNGSRPTLQMDIPNAADVTALVWYRDDEHLFVEYPDHVAFLDFEDIALKNYDTAAASGVAAYDISNNILYFLNDDVLYDLPFASS